jgi:hypothetical protein
LLKNNLSRDKSGDKTGDGIFLDFFLCFEIEDEDLPWDATQVDW